MEIKDIVNGVTVTLCGTEHITITQDESSITVHKNTWNLIKESVDKMIRMSKVYQELK